MDELTSQYPPLPAGDLKRSLTIAQVDRDESLSHLGLAGDSGRMVVRAGFVKRVSALRRE